MVDGQALRGAHACDPGSGPTFTGLGGETPPGVQLSPVAQAWWWGGGSPEAFAPVPQAGCSRWLPVPCLPRAGQWMETGTSGRAGAHAPPAAPRAGSSAHGSATGRPTGALSARATGWRLGTASSSSAQVRTVPWVPWGVPGGHLGGSVGQQGWLWGLCLRPGGGLGFFFPSWLPAATSLGPWVSVSPGPRNCAFLVPICVPRAWLCPAVDGKWQTWASWGGCSVTCGGGTQRRERVCSGPFFGGAACQGPQDEQRPCGAQRCPGECPASHPTLGSREELPSSWAGLGLSLLGTALPGDSGCSGRVLALPRLLPAPGPPSHTLPHALPLASRQSPMRSVTRTTSARWSGRRLQQERWLQSGVPAMPQVRAGGTAHVGLLSHLTDRHRHALRRLPQRAVSSCPQKPGQHGWARCDPPQ